MGELLSTAEAARRLGVKPATLYAYVSRGLVTSHRAVDGRTSRFDADEIGALARRARRRAGAVDVSVATAITSIVDGRLRFRAHDAIELVSGQPFERVAELLWQAEAEPWEPDTSTVETVQRVLGLVPEADVATRLRLAVELVGAGDSLRADLRPASVVAVGRRLLITVTAALSGGATPARLDKAGHRHRGTVAGHLVAALGIRRDRGRNARFVDTALGLLADHELATSTFAARVAASTRADPYASVLAGLAAVSGPLHGAASAEAHRLLDRIAVEGLHPTIGEMLANGARLPGFGHQLYPEGDPRGRLLLDLLAQEHPGPAQDRVAALVELVADRGLPAPNVDLGLAAWTHLRRLPPESGELIFSLARMAGWLAHVIEEYGEAPLRFRLTAAWRQS